MKKNSLSSKLLQILVVTLPLLLMAAGFEIVGRSFDGKSSTLTQDGAVATATVYKVTEDVLGETLQVVSDSQRNVSSNRRSDIKRWKLHYRFSTDTDSVCEGSYNVQAYDRPSEGETLQVRYSLADPSVHETAIGHTESQGAALHWLALIFGLIGLITGCCMAIQPFLPRRMTTREKRLKRSAKLKQNST